MFTFHRSIFRDSPEAGKARDFHLFSSTTQPRLRSPSPALENFFLQHQQHLHRHSRHHGRLRLRLRCFAQQAPEDRT